MVNERDLLSNDVRAVFDDYENIIYVSSESITEFIHLIQTGKVIIKKDSLDVFDLIENTLGFNVKYVTKEHLRTFAKLDLVEGHRDPSDRLIIAQALTEKMPLISSDTKFPKYRKQGLDLIFNQ
jgi:PIN domain nuclease of toxin-antitoxin system